MTRDDELFGAAMAVARRHGDGAVFYAAARIEEFMRRDEPDACALWVEIGDRIPLALERVSATPS